MFLRRRQPARQRPLVEELEPRILYSADATAGLLSTNQWNGEAEVRQLEAPAPTATSGAIPGGNSAYPGVTRAAEHSAAANEIAFVDMSVANADSLLTGLLAERDAGRAIEIVRIEAGADGIAVISDTLAQRQAVTAVHLLSHGSDGQLQLGAATLDAQTLPQRADDLAAWGAALTADADLLLYGCDFAQSTVGQGLVQYLATLTGADVAASSDLTGAVALGGNWTLEHASGSIEARVALSSAEQSEWAGLLATYNADPSKADGAVGSLRWAITQANANAGADTVQLLAGTYTLTLTGSSEDFNVSGDLDIRGSVTVIGAGAGSTVISGANALAVLNIVSGTANVSGLTIADGRFNGSGAGITVNAGATLALNQVIVRDNTTTSGHGAGIYNRGALTLTDVELRDNSAHDEGGGIQHDGTSLTLERVVLADNSAKYGGGLYLNGGAASLSNVTISGNTTEDEGAGVYVKSGASLSLIQTIVRNNTTTSEEGAGIYNDGSLTLTDVDVRDNSAWKGGGGIYHKGSSLTLERVTLATNSASQGGGLYADGGAASLSNVTISGNTTGDKGGGIYLKTSASLLNTTIADNTGSQGGGIERGGGSVTLRNVIVANNAGGNIGSDNGSSGVVSLGNNLSTTNTPELNQVSDRKSVAAGISALANNGGYTRTHALLESSAAINGGHTASAPATDQRGTARLGAADIGAYEYTPASGAPVNTVPGAQNTNEDSDLVFSTANGNALSISDANSAGGSPELTLAITNGTATLGGTSGLTFTAGSNGTSTMTFRGSYANINAALDGLTYSSTADFNGSAELTISTLDETLVALNIDAALKGRYTFDNASDLGNDGSPAGVYDGSGAGGATAAVDVTRGKVLNLDAAGGADYVQITGHFGNPASVTLAAWVNLTNGGVFGPDVISLGDSAALRLDEFGYLKGFIFNGSSWKTINYATTLVGTGWHHVAYSFDDAGNVQKLYLDGVQVAALAETGSIAYTLGPNSTIGTHGNGQTTHDYTGKIDDARIYSRALTAAEIANLASDLNLLDTDNVTITVAAVADTPSVSNATTNEDTQSTSGLVISRNAADGAEVTHFKITAISNGTLYQNNGTAQIANDSFITFAEGNAGLKFSPTAGFSGASSFTVQASTSNGAGGLGGSTVSATITVNAVANTPSVTNATTDEDTQSTSGLVISRNAADGAEVTHFKISGISNGTLYRNDGTTQIANDSFITFAEGNAGLKFTPTQNFNGNGSFSVQASTASNDGGLGGSTVDATITVVAVADTPSVSNATTNEDAQSTSGLVITRNAADGGEVSHFKITGIGNGTLYQSDGTTPIANGSFITVAQGSAGLKFTPTPNFNGNGSFTVQASTASNDGGLSGSTVDATITVAALADTPAVSNATTDEDTQSTSGLVITRNAADGTEITHFKITGIANGTLYRNNGTTQIANGSFITVAQGNAGLKFTPTQNFNGNGSFTVQASTASNDGGLGGSTVDAMITVAAVADTPAVSNATTNEDTQSTSGLVISRNAADSSEASHFKITGISNGTLYQNDGTTQIANGSFITVAQGNAGLKFTPTPNFSGAGGFTVQASTAANDGGLGGSTVDATITVAALADTPSVSNATTNEDTQSTSGLVISRNAADSSEVSHFKITGIGNGTLYQNDGSTIISDGDFISFAQGNAGLKFTPAPNFSGAGGFTVQASTASNDGGLGGSTADATITVAAVADTPSVSNATTNEDTQSTSGLVISRNAADSSEVTHFKITGIGNGTLYQNEGSTIISDGDFISFAQGNAGLKFTPTLNFSGAGGFTVQASTAANDAGLGGSTVDATITVAAVADTPSVSNASTNEDTQSTSGLVITRNAADSTEVTHFKITGISNGTLYRNNGTTQIANGSFITVAQGSAGLKFTPTPNFNGNGRFTVQASTASNDGGLGGSTADATITVAAVADTPSVSNATTNEDTQSASGLVISRNAADSNEITHFTITGISNGTLYQNDGSTVISDGDFISFAQGNAGLKFTPAPNFSGAGGFTVQASTAANSGGLGGNTVDATITVAALADTPTVTNATTNEDTQSASGLVISRNAADSTEVTHFKITGISNGTLYRNNGTTQITNGSFITVAQGNAGLKFTPAPNFNGNASFTVQASMAANNGGLGGSTVDATITVAALADTPTVTNATTNEDTQSTSGLVITRNAADSSEVSHFKITGISNGTLYQNDGSTVISDGDFISFAQGNAGLKFTPAPSFSGSGGFTVQASTAANSGGLGGSTVDATITVAAVADTPSVSNATTNEDTQSTSGLVISRNAADGAEVTHFKITGISNGTLYQNNGTTQIANGSFITVAQGSAGLKFTPAPNFNGNASFTVQASMAANNGGLGGSTVDATVTVAALADTPSVSNATTNEDTQSTNGLVISRNAADGTEITHFKITGISNGTLYQNDGSTVINDGDFISFAQGNAGLKFTPNASFSGSASFTVQASTSSSDAGLGGSSVNATITVNTGNGVNDAPTLGDGTLAAVSEDTDSPAGETVSTIFRSQFSDIDAGSSFGGIVVVGNPANAGTQGAWQYSSDAGGNWFVIGVVADDATALAVSSSSLIRFVPVAGYTGTPSALTVRGLDDTYAGGFSTTTGAETRVTVDTGSNGGITAIAGATASLSTSITAVADTPSVSNASTDEDTQSSSGLVITRNAADSNEVTYFKITGISNGTLYQNDGSTVISDGDFISFAQGNGGLKFTPAPNFSGAGGFTVQASTAANDAGLGGSTVDATITVAALADTPSVSNATTNEDTQSASGLVISRNAADSTEVTHFKITGISNGTLYQNDGSTVISDGDFISFAQGNAGLKFTPAPNFNGNASFTVQASMAANNGGLGGSTVDATVTVAALADTPTVTNATTNEDTQSASGLVISRNAADSNEVTDFKITGISNGTLFLNDGSTVISFAQGNAGLKFTPAQNFSGAGGFTVQASTAANDAGLGGSTADATITVAAVADTPSVSNATTNEDTQSASGLVISRNAADSNEITHFKITGISNGTLYQNDGSTVISDGDFISFAQGNAGLKFTPAPNFSGAGGFTVQASTAANDASLGGSTADATITVAAVADTPSVSNATINEDTQSTSGLVISRNAADGAEVTHFKITGISNGTLYQNDGSTVISDGDFISFAQGNAGLKFTPAPSFSGSGGFTVQASTAANDGGLGGSTVDATITVAAVADTPSVSNATTNEDAQSTSGLVISRNAADSNEITHFKITGISNGTLYQNDGSTVISDGDFISFAQGNGGLKFTPAPNFNGNASFTVQASTAANDAGLGGSTVDATITINAANDQPVVTATGTMLAYTENAAATDIDPGLTVSDVDSANLIGATVTILANYAGGQDVLAFSDTASITGSWNAAIGTLTLAGSDTVANYQTALRTVTYVNTSDGPSTSTRTVSFVVNDGAASSTPATRDVSVTPDNDLPAGLPTISGTPAEDQTLSVDVSTITDADGLGVFSYRWLRDGVAIAGAGTATYTLGDADVGARISAQVSYTDAQGRSEGPLTSAKTTAVVNVNDAAVIGGVTAGTVTEDGVLVAAGRLSISDADVGEAAFVARVAAASAQGFGVFSLGTGGDWTYSLNNEHAAVQRLAGGQRLADYFVVSSVDGTTARVSIVIIGSNALPSASAVSAGGSEDQPLTITLGGDDADGVIASFRLLTLPTLDGALYLDTAANTPAVAGVPYAATGNALRLHFRPSADWNGTTTFQYQAIDAQAAVSTAATVRLSLAAVADSPQILGLTSAHKYLPNTALELRGMVVSDVDSVSISVRLTLSDPAAGTLSSSDFGSIRGNYHAATGTWSASGLIADVNGLLASLRFVPSASYSADLTLAATVDDGEAPLVSGKQAISTLRTSGPAISNSSWTNTAGASAVDAAPLAAAPVAQQSEPESSERGADSRAVADTLATLDYALTVGYSLPTLFATNGLLGSATDTPSATAVVASTRPLADAGNYRIAAVPDWMSAEFPQFVDFNANPVSDSFSLSGLAQAGSASAGKVAALVRDLDDLRDSVREGVAFEKYALNSAVAVSTGLSVGYVAWLIRGGVLISALLSSMPAWRVLDPFPVLARQGRADGDDGYDDAEEDDDYDDDDSLESLVNEDHGAGNSLAPDVSGDNASEPAPRG